MNTLADRRRGAVHAFPHRRATVAEGKDIFRNRSHVIIFYCSFLMNYSASKSKYSRHTIVIVRRHHRRLLSAGTNPHRNRPADEKKLLDFHSENRLGIPLRTRPFPRRIVICISIKCLFVS